MIIAIFLGESVTVLHPLNYGIEVNGPEIRIQEGLWESGRHFIGLDHYFIEFPR